MNRKYYLLSECPFFYLREVFMVSRDSYVDFYIIVRILVFTDQILNQICDELNNILKTRKKSIFKSYLFNIHRLFLDVPGSSVSSAYFLIVSTEIASLCFSGRLKKIQHNFTFYLFQWNIVYGSRCV